MRTIKQAVQLAMLGSLGIGFSTISHATPAVPAGQLLTDFFQVNLQLQTAQDAGITDIALVGDQDDSIRTLTNTYVFDWDSFVPGRSTARFKEGDWAGLYSGTLSANVPENRIDHVPATGTADMDYWPKGGELYDVEALYLDTDANYIYLAIVTSVPFVDTYSEDPANSCSPANTFTATGIAALGFESLIGLEHCPQSNLASTLVRPGDIALDLGLGTLRTEKNGTGFRYDYGIDLINENRNDVYESTTADGSIVLARGVLDRDISLGDQLYKTTYDVGGSNTTNEGNLAVGDWYTSTYVGFADAHWEHTNFDPVTSNLTPLGSVQTAYYRKDFPGGILENGADTWVIEAVIPRSLFGADNPQPGDQIGISWVEGCRNDGNDNDAIMRLYSPVVETFSLGNYIWVDDNNNGQVDSGELPVSDGVVVELLCAGDNVITSTTTTNGFYLFDQLAAGTYKVRIPASQFDPTNGNLAGYRHVTGTGQEANPDLDGDNNDNGLDITDLTVEGITTALLTLGGAPDEPIQESTDGTILDSNGNVLDADGNLTLDLGVRPPASVVDLALEKVANTAQARRGDTVIYTLTVSNSGPDTATGVQITDTLPAEVTYISDNSGGQYINGLWEVGTLLSGESRSIAITVIVN